jgi:tetratricopeptide (TPR) repeat protein
VNDATASHEQRSVTLGRLSLPLPPLRTIAIGAGAVLALALLGVGAWFWNVSQQQRGSAALAGALTAHRAADGPEATPEARAAGMRDLERLLAEYPSNELAPQAAQLLGNLRFVNGQYEGARAAYQITIARTGSSTVATLARAGVGYTWEAERKLPEATQAFEAALADLKPTSFYYEELLSDLARVQERSGKKEAAVTTYRRLLKDLPTSPRAPEIRARLASLGATP